MKAAKLNKEDAKINTIVNVHNDNSIDKPFYSHTDTLIKDIMEAAKLNKEAIKDNATVISKDVSNMLPPMKLFWLRNCFIANAFT